MAQSSGHFRDRVYRAIKPQFWVIDVPSVFPTDEDLLGVRVITQVDSSRVTSMPVEIHISRDGGSVYEQVALSLRHGHIGVLLNTESDTMTGDGLGIPDTSMSGHSPNSNYHQTLKVSEGAHLAQGNDNCSLLNVAWKKQYYPQSISESGINNNKNLLLVGGEVMQFQNAVLIGAFETTAGAMARLNAWRHYTLLRGRRGTENKISSVATADTVVALEENRSVFIPLRHSDIGREIYFKCMTKGMTLADSATKSITFEAESLKPFAPSNTTVMRNSAQDCVIAWKRRCRNMVRLMGVKYLPYGEDTDDYEIDIMTPATPRTVLRTITVSGATTATYTASQQVADGLTLGNAVFMQIYQISNMTGRGQTNTVTASASSTPNWVAPTTHTT